MIEPIPRRLYPETRDEQAMRRFMLGTLNVGHNMTFQRKSMIVNVSPQPSEREILAHFFDLSGVQRSERCYNARLNMHQTPLPDNLRLSRESEYNRFPYSHAEVTLTPANAISETGKRRNMHMQTHDTLPNAPTVNVYGVGYRKGEVAMLQFVKDCVTFQHDLERDEAETAARGQRPFVLPLALDATDRLTNLPAHPTLILRDLFDSQPEQAPTPSSVAARARSAAAALLYPAIGDTECVDLAVRTSAVACTTEAPYPHIVPASTLMQLRRTAPIEKEIGSTSRLADRIRQSSTHLEGVDTEADLYRIVDEGLRAAKIIFPRALGPEICTPLPISTLPDTKLFLDLERCRAVLRNANISQSDIFATWQAHKDRVRRTSWPVSDPGESSASAAKADDSGVLMTDDAEKADCGHSIEAPSTSAANWDQFAFQMISPERPRRTHIEAEEGEVRASESVVLTPRLSAASTLLSLSPSKSAASFDQSAGK